MLNKELTVKLSVFKRLNIKNNKHSLDPIFPWLLNYSCSFLQANFSRTAMFSPCPHLPSTL